MEQCFPILSTITCSIEGEAGTVSTRLIMWSWLSIRHQIWLLLGWNETLQPHGRLHRHPWYEAFSPFECSLTISWSQFHTTILRHTMSIWFFFLPHSISCSAFAVLCRVGLFPTRLKKDHKLNLSDTWEFQDTMLQILKLYTLSSIISQFVSYTQSNRDAIQYLWGSNKGLTQTDTYPQCLSTAIHGP